MLLLIRLGERHPLGNSRDSRYNHWRKDNQGDSKPWLHKTMNNRDIKILVGAGLALFGLWLLNSKPQCNRGCRTVAEHLLEHGITDVVVGLFA